ncbi:LysR family transcriptional regulator [Sinisalibacter aestuarii]|nr:LysR family transcriptional regulator [Sinisalibacter aestuarii]
MDLKQLRYFLAIAEEGTLSAAARRLNVAQPALTHHLRNMETELGVELFRRHPRGVALTEAGSLLRQRATLLLSEFERTRDDIRNLEGDPRGEVRLGLPATISEILSVPLILSAQDALPGIKLTIAEAMSGFVLDWLKEGLVDIAVLYLRDPSGELSSEPLLREELVVVSPHGAEIGERVSMRDLCARNLVLPSRTHGLRMQLEQEAAAVGATLQPINELDSFVNIKRLVAAGHCSSVLPLHAVTHAKDKGRFRISHFDGNGLFRDVFLVARERKTLSHACAAISMKLQECVESIVEKGEWRGAFPMVGQDANVSDSRQ